MIRPYVDKQLSLIRPYLSDLGSVLDFGCGDLSLARRIMSVYPKLRVTGVDVVDSGVRVRGIDYKLYDGKRLPFKNNSFDTTIVYHVFHHCADPEASLRDVSRVTKKTILIVEPVYRNSLDLFFMKIMDRLGNGWRGVVIPMPFTFQRDETWAAWAGKHNWKIRNVKVAGVLPAWLPVGVTKLFVLTR